LKRPSKSAKLEQIMRAKPVRTSDFQEKKRRRERIAMLTAYDATMAAVFDRAGIDALLVGDSVGMVMLGYETTLPVSLEVMIHHTAAVSRGASRAMVIADMPFLTYQVTIADAVRNAGRLLKEGGAAAVKLEGGRPVLDVVRRLVDVGIPVMGHLGLQPQSVHQLGGYRKRGTWPHEAEMIVEDAEALQQAGAFSVVLESIPDELARRVTQQIDVPTIGIGAGPHCDGQVLVSSDMLGLIEDAPPFVKQYANLAETIAAAAASYKEDVRTGRFPAVRTPVPEAPVI
jgi:3-methyl-2-oxobutanoate hydroxymethyltransferase